MNKNTTFKLISFFKTAFFVSIAAYMWFYVKIIFSNSHSLFFRNISINIENYKTLINNDIHILYFITSILLLFGILAIILKRRDPLFETSDIIKYTVLLIDTWLTVVIVYFYILFAMQGDSQTPKIASALTMTALMLLINMWVVEKEEKFIRNKVYFYIAILATILISYFTGREIFSSFFELIAGAFALNFFSIFVFATYFAFDKLKLNGILYILLFAVIFPALISLIISALYIIFYLLTSLFTGFDQSEIFSDFFMSYFMYLLDSLVSNTLAISTLSGLIASLLIIWGWSNFINNFEEKRNYYRDIEKSDYIKIAIGTIGILSIIATLPSGQTNKNLTQQADFLTFVSSPADTSQIFIDKNYVYRFVKKSGKSWLEVFDKNLIIRKKIDIPYFDKIKKTNDKEFLSVVLNPDSVRISIISANKGIKTDTFITQEDYMEFYKYIAPVIIQNDTLIFVSGYNSFLFTDTRANVIWQQNNIDIPFFDGKYFFITKNNLILFSWQTDSILVINPNEKSTQKYSKLSDIFGFPVFEFYYTLPDYGIIVKYSPDKVDTIKQFAGTIKYVISDDYAYIQNWQYIYRLNRKTPKLDTIYIDMRKKHDKLIECNDYIIVATLDFNNFINFKLYDKTYNSDSYTLLYNTQRYKSIDDIIIERDTLYLSSQDGLSIYFLEKRN